MIALGLVLAALGLTAAVIYRGQEKYVFEPQALPPDYAFRMPDVTEEPVAVRGATLSALHLRVPDAKGIVFYLHGNAGNLANWFANADFYRAAGFDLFMIDYRGYGKSSGRIRSEAQLRADVAAAWRQVAPEYAGRRKVFIGRSLGTGLIARLAAQERPDLTILVSPYWSMTEVAHLHYPLLPAILFRYPLETWRDIGRIDGPVLLVHGDRDTLIPFSHSERLRDAARHVQLVTIHGAAHGDLQNFPAYRAAIAQALAAL